MNKEKEVHCRFYYVKRKAPTSSEFFDYFDSDGANKHSEQKRFAIYLSLYTYLCTCYYATFKIVWSDFAAGPSKVHNSFVPSPSLIRFKDSNKIFAFQGFRN